MKGNRVGDFQQNIQFADAISAVNSVFRTKQTLCTRIEQTCLKILVDREHRNSKETRKRYFNKNNALSLFVTKFNK